MRQISASLLGVLAIIGQTVAGSAQEAEQRSTISHEDLNNSNNPLNPAITLNLHNYYIPSFDGPLDLNNSPLDLDADAFLLRGLVPMMLFDTPNLMRFSIPVITEPTLDGGHTTGWGDLLVFDVAVFEQKGWAFGVGPLLGAPTASRDRFGSGKWQAGVAGAFVVPQDWGLVGGLATYQKSFAGDDDRADVQLAEFQPFIFYNLPEGFYLQSTAAWTFNLENDSWSIPVGLGVGKLFQLTPDVKMNAFIEPQYTVASEGFAPEWKIFAGLNFSYSLEKFLKK